MGRAHPARGRGEAIETEPHEIALLALFAGAVAAILFTAVVVVSVDRSVGREGSGEERNTGGGEEDERGEREENG